MRTPPRILVALLAASLLPLASCGDDKPSTPSTDASDDGDAAEDVADDTSPSTDTTPSEDVALDGTPSDAIDDTGDTNVDPLEGVQIPGLSVETTVWFDTDGILHAQCATDNDCAAVLGYFHARDRFLQMDIRRRLTTGRLTQATGPLGTDIAESYRRIFTTPSGEPLETRLAEAMPAEARAYFEAYANGVNAWLDDLDAGRNGAALPEETRFPLVNFTNIPRWTVEDSFATILALVESLTNDSSAIISRGRIFAELDADILADFFTPRTPVDAPTVADYTFDGGTSAAKDLRGTRLPVHHALLRRASGALAEADRRLVEAGMFRENTRGANGSNIWAVHADNSATGNALFSNDPHLTLSNPAIWYIAHLDAKTHGDGTFHVAGVTFAGLPYVILGQNEDIAWGATTTYFDMTDVYIETLNDDGTAVIFNGEEVPLIERDWVYEYPDGTSETRTAYYVPHHGPVLSIDEDAGTAVSMRWTGNQILTDGWFLMDLMRAENVGEARDAFRMVTTIGQNWTVADRAGNIGWFPYNTVPFRPWASLELPTSLPLPGDGSAEWEGYFDYDDLPQAFNPAAGFIANANNDMTGALHDGNPYNDGYPPLQVDAAPGYRQARMLEVLEASTEHTVESMLDLVGDTHSLLGEWITPLLLDAASDAETLTEAQQRTVDALTGWDYRCTTGLATGAPDGDVSSDPADAASSIGCAAFHVTLGRVWAETFDDNRAVPFEDVAYPRLDRAIELLIRPEIFTTDLSIIWDDLRTEGVTETRDDILRRALDLAGTWLSNELGDDIDGWRWGRIHTLTLRADLFDNLGVANYNAGPWATPGGIGTVNVAFPSSIYRHTYAHGSGASMRFVCELLPSGPSCTIQLPGGQRHARGDENYNDLIESWRTNTPTAMRFDIDAVAADASARPIVLRPAP